MILSHFKVRNYPSVLLRLGKVMIAENHFEDVSEEGNLSLGKMLHYSVRDTVRVRSVDDLETPGSFVNLFSGG